MLSEENRVDIVSFSQNIPPDAVVVDLRNAISFQMGTIPGARNIPIDNLGALYELPMDKKIYVFCQSGEVSGEIVELLLDAGYQAYDLTGGFREYLRAQFMRMEREDKG